MDNGIMDSLPNNHYKLSHSPLYCFTPPKIMIAHYIYFYKFCKNSFVPEVENI
jgi:hypothetical protein